MSFLYEQDQDSTVTRVSTYLSDFVLHGLKKAPASSKSETHEKANALEFMCVYCTSCSTIDTPTMSHPHIYYITILAVPGLRGQGTLSVRGQARRGQARRGHARWSHASRGHAKRGHTRRVNVLLATSSVSLQRATSGCLQDGVNNSSVRMSHQQIDIVCIHESTNQTCLCL